MEEQRKEKRKYSPAVRVIIMFGIISMLGDMIYETARSANSQYLNLLGISAAQVGLVFGIGEFLGYFLRLIAGLLSDKTGRPWLFMFIGYSFLIAVPIMGFTQNWNWLIVLILMERIGKSIRNPAKDTVLSEVAENEVGVGFAFGLQEALDQIGAFLGPLIFTAVFYFKNRQTLPEYQLGYKLLFVPFVLLILFLIFAHNNMPEIRHDDAKMNAGLKSDNLNRIFWLYTAFTFFASLGFMNFSIIGYHLKEIDLISDGNITLIYSMAMAIDAITAIILGKTYDKKKELSSNRAAGLKVLIIIPILSMILSFLGLSNNITLIIIAMIVFGIVMGAHETIMRSAIADITPYNKRGTSYGIFNTGYGIALLIGSSLMGYLYQIGKVDIIIIFTVVVEIVAIILYRKIVSKLDE